MLKNCKVCLKEFECFDKPKARSRATKRKAKRPSKSVTCSPKCSKKYFVDWHEYHKK